MLLRTHEFTASVNESFRLDIFNIYDEGAKQLFREFPFSAESSGSTSVPHLLFVRFGDFAEQVIINAARKWSPYYEKTGQQMNISIIDPHVVIHIRKICHESSLIARLCDWESLEFDTNSIEFLKADFLFDEDKKPDVSVVYVTVEDESIGLTSALMLLERMGSYPVKILVRVNGKRACKPDPRIKEEFRIPQAAVLVWPYGADLQTQPHLQFKPRVHLPGYP